MESELAQGCKCHDGSKQVWQWIYTRMCMCVYTSMCMCVSIPACVCVSLHKYVCFYTSICLCMSTPAWSVHPRDIEVQPEAPIKALEKHPCIRECKSKISYWMKYKAVKEVNFFWKESVQVSQHQNLIHLHFVACLMLPCGYCPWVPKPSCAVFYPK